GGDGRVVHAVEARQIVADVGSQPWLRRRAAAALVHEPPIGALEAVGYQAAAFEQLLLIARSLRHGLRNTVRGEDQMRFRMPVAKFNHRFNKLWMVIENTKLIDLWRVAFASLFDVAQILPTARVRTEGRGHKGEGTVASVRSHLL